MAGMGRILPSRRVPYRSAAQITAFSAGPEQRSSSEGLPVPAPPARQITLTAAERRRLKALAYSHTAPYQQVIRVRIVRDAAHGYSNAKIARRQGVTIDTVRR